MISITQVKAGDAFNVIPEFAILNGTVRTLSESVRDLCEARIAQVASNVAAAFGATATADYGRGYPVTANDPGRSSFMADVAAEVSGEGAVERAVQPMMGAEDFSYMLNARPAPTSSSAPVRVRACTTRPTTSTTRPRPTACRCSPG